jgi:hypothetical protein
MRPMSMKEKEAKKMIPPRWFSADRPIERREHDKLGRRNFAEAIVAAISDWDGKDSLVITLYGP